MRRYVAGFVFVRGGMQVMLIRKNKPVWQRARLNAVGGKIENGESAVEAMIRECDEEAGLAISGWRRFCVLRGTQPDEWEVHFFTVELPHDMIKNGMRTKTSEPVGLYNLWEVTSSTAIPNLPWLLAMARNMDYDLHVPVKEYIISEQY